ncbi:MAG: DNA-protecting protein DprA [Proteobacteria bacterium]|nr:MAG: DNA-protecting protein DprA [Pseudomonadota bacterium]PIE65312.1 MAG: DNA-protecting protein DprA [Desulfobacterales bacterium]
MDEKRACIALSIASGLGPVGVGHLLEIYGTARSVLKAAARGLPDNIGLNKGQYAALSDVGLLTDRADKEMRRLEECGGEAVVFSDDAYPDLLAESYNPPFVLYTCGDRSLLSRPSVAVIGSRAATKYGRRAAFSISAGLAERGVAVVSGLAAGIDAEAHSGCLYGRGKTIAVLGCGLDTVYPRSNQKLYMEIADKGLLVSEYPLGTKPEPFRFPARNRIIAGLSLGVVVVEAARKSGSLITVQYALDEGREVFAVPGQIDSVKSTGTHWLLQQGAFLVQSADDIVTHLQIGTAAMDGQSSLSLDAIDLDPVSKRIFAAIENYPVSRDQLLDVVELSPAELSKHLLLLEIEGFIEMLPGDEVRRIGSDSH